MKQSYGPEVFVLKPQDIGYLEPILLDRQGRLQVVPYAAIRDVPQEHLSLFCVKHGIYCLPTQELIDCIRTEIGSQSAIEIGAGNGAIARALGITATDSHQQDRPDMQVYYALMQQPTVQYGENVRRMDALTAVRHYRPHTVVAAWVTHKWDPRRPALEGNAYGVDEEKILSKVRRYIFVGNEGVHGKKPILDRPHRTIRADWLLSRSPRTAENFIKIWER